MSYRGVFNNIRRILLVGAYPVKEGTNQLPNNEFKIGVLLRAEILFKNSNTSV